MALSECVMMRRAAVAFLALLWAVYQLRLQQLRRQFNIKLEERVGARLPYARHVDDATLETRDGRLLQVLHLAGLPFETAGTEDLNYRKTVRETA